MRTLTRTGFLIVFCVTTLTPNRGSAQVGAAVGIIAGNTLVSSLLNQIKNEIQTLISQASAEVTFNGFFLQQQLSLLLQNTDRVAEGVETKTFRDLDSSQQQFFGNVQATLTKWSDVSLVNTHEVGDLLDSANDVLSRLPLTSKDPRVIHYDPAYVVANVNSPMTVIIRGSLLGNNTPTLKLANMTDCSLLTHIESMLQFSCPAAAIHATPEKVSPVTGDLTVFKPLPWYRFWGTPDPVKYKVAFFIVPQVLANFDLVATVKTSATQTKNRKQSWYYSNGFCQGEHDDTWVATAMPGWAIDPDTISVTETTKDGDTGWTTAYKNTGGFAIKLQVRNAGGCGLFWSDARGWLGLTAYWTESQTTEGITTQAQPGGQLRWGQAQSLPALPNGTVGFTFTAHVLGTATAVSTTDPNSDNTAWYVLSYTPATRVIAVTPKPPSLALASQ